MFEIDIDVRRLVTFGRNEPLEQQINAGWIDRRNTETITNRRMRRRPPALAQDIVFPSKADRVVHC